MRIYYLFFPFILIRCIVAQVPLLIITHAFERPDFIELQWKTFKKFLKDPYDFVVFNDAIDQHKSEAIKNICNALHIKCFHVPQNIHSMPYLERLPGESYINPCTRCANVVQYSLDTIGFFHPGIVVIIDSDMFLMKPLSILEYMNQHDMAAVPQSRGTVEYLWNGLVFLNIPMLPEVRTLNFNCGQVDNYAVDVGGHTAYYLRKFSHLRLGKLSVLHINNLYCNECQQKQNICNHNRQLLQENQFDERSIKFIQQGPHNIEYIFDNHFLHYRGGGNWDNKPGSYHQQKTELLLNFIGDLLHEK